MRFGNDLNNTQGQPATPPRPARVFVQPLILPHPSPDPLRIAAPRLSPAQAAPRAPASAANRTGQPSNVCDACPPRLDPEDRRPTPHFAIGKRPSVDTVFPVKPAGHNQLGKVDGF